jgi:hypothetical protein
MRLEDAAERHTVDAERLIALSEQFQTERDAARNVQTWCELQHAETRQLLMGAIVREGERNAEAHVKTHDFMNKFNNGSAVRGSALVCTHWREREHCSRLRPLRRPLLPLHFRCDCFKKQLRPAQVTCLPHALCEKCCAHSLLWCD